MRIKLNNNEPEELFSMSHIACGEWVICGCHVAFKAVLLAVIFSPDSMTAKVLLPEEEGYKKKEWKKLGPVEVETLELNVFNDA